MQDWVQSKVHFGSVSIPSFEMVWINTVHFLSSHSTHSTTQMSLHANQIEFVYLT